MLIASWKRRTWGRGRGGGGLADDPLYEAARRRRKGTGRRDRFMGPDAADVVGRQLELRIRPSSTATTPA